MKSFLFTLFLWVFLTHSALSQGWRIAPTFGLNVSTISYSSAFRNSLNSTSTKTGALIRAQVGVLADYAFSDRFSVRSGLLVTGKGGSLRVDATQYGIVESVRGRYQFDYLEVPLLLNFAVGHHNWRIILGGVSGITLSAKGIVEGGRFAGYGYYGGNTANMSIGSGPGQVKAFDLSTNVGFVKELTVLDRPLELGLYFQRSLSNWNSSSTIQPDLYARNQLIGLRVAYLFELRR